MSSPSFPTNPTIPTSDCAQLDDTTTTITTENKQENRASHPIIQLSQFLTPDSHSPLSSIRRTAQYASNPTKYLQDLLGPEVFAERREKLCLFSGEIDRDVCGVGEHKEHFEKHVARLLGKEHGLFFITGVQAQLSALRVHCDFARRGRRVAWHVSSHLEGAEEGAYEALHGMERILVGGDAMRNPSVEEIEEVVCGPEENRPAAVLLEIPNRTLGCETYSFEEMRAISERCRGANVRLHCDGARLWEIEPYYWETEGKSFADIGRLFDSIYVSFYKGLQGSSGALLVSDDAHVIASAKTWQRRAGGDVFTVHYQVIDAERGFNENIGSFAAKRDKMMEVAARIKDATSGYQNSDGTPYVSFAPDRTTCCQTHTVFQGFSADELMAARDRVQETTGIRVFERLRPKRTVVELQEAENSVENRKHFTEWMIIETTLEIDTDVFVDGYVALCEALKSGS